MSKKKGGNRVSTRLPGWDYGGDGSYFITILTQNRKPFFGDIKAGQIHLSDIGVLATQHWCRLTEYHKHIELGAFVVMPNHLHGIIQLKGSNTSKHKRKDQALIWTPEWMSAISPRAGSVSTIIRNYKAGVSREGRRILPKFAWHRGYHDHIIRSRRAYEAITQYILENPSKYQAQKV